MRPFIKWVGGKQRLSNIILDTMPDKIEHYYEPFVGGGAIFFALQWKRRIKHATLSDINEELINAYRIVRDEPLELIQSLEHHKKEHSVDDDYFYQVRSSRPDCNVGRASRLIYLNKTCYNGLFRVNKYGNFNSAKGKYRNPVICDTPTILQTSRALEGVELRVGSFENLKPKHGSFIYCDPPYYGAYVDYYASGFDLDKQHDLFSEIENWLQTGCNVLVSNSDTYEMRELYDCYWVTELTVGSHFNPRTGKKGQRQELLILMSVGDWPKENWRKYHHCYKEVQGTLKVDMVEENRRLDEPRPV